MHEPRTGGRAPLGDRARAFDVDGGVDVRVSSAPTTPGEMHDGVGAGERLGERARVERRPDLARAAGAVRDRAGRWLRTSSEQVASRAAR